MNICVDKFGDLKEISFINEILSSGDEEDLIETIESLGNCKLVINFKKTPCLSEKITGFLTALIIKYNDRIKIKTQKKNLSIYLSTIGIKNDYTYLNTNNEILRAIGISLFTNDPLKISEIVNNIPYADITIFIVNHFQEDFNKKLPEVLRYQTKYSIIIPDNKQKIEKNTIYITPPHCHLIVNNDYVEPINMIQSSYSRPSTQILFDSLVKKYKSSFAAIYVSDYEDGEKKSVDYIMENGGKIIILDSQKNQKSKFLNEELCLNLEELKNYFTCHLSRKKFDNGDFEDFLNDIYRKYDYDFRNFQKESLKRRIELSMLNLSITNFKEFRKKILSEHDLFEDMLNDLTIGVTDFFRDPNIYLYLSKKIFPYLKTFPNIKIWCAGCSSGEEVYSLAILLKESGLLDRTYIYATDINKNYIQEAKNGFYSISNLKEQIRNYLIAGGTEDFGDYFDINKVNMIIKKELKERVVFYEHNLINSGIINEFQLIICRNVLIYFNEDLQKQILDLFYHSLDPNGFLILGKNEVFTEQKNTLFNLINKEVNSYRKSVNSGGLLKKYHEQL